MNMRYDSYEKVSKGFTLVGLNNKYGLVKAGKEIVPPKYDYIGYFYESLAAVRLKDKWGFINQKGEEVIPCMYEMAGSFSEGLAPVQLHGKWGFVNKKNKVIIPFRYSGVAKFVERLAIVSKENKQGYINKKGEEVIPTVFDDVQGYNYFYDNFLKAEIKDFTFCILNLKGDVL